MTDGRIQVQPGCCDGCSCEDCSGTEHAQYSVQLFSFTNNTCSDCADLNTTFVLDKDLTGLCAAGNSYDDHPCCCWAYYFPDEEPCGAYRLTLVIINATQAYVILESDPGAGGYWSFTWIINSGDICEIEGVTSGVPLIDGSPPCFGIISVAKVTAL